MAICLEIKFTLFKVFGASTVIKTSKKSNKKINSGRRHARNCENRNLSFEVPGEESS